MRIGTITDLIDRYENTVSSTVHLCDPHFQNLADHSDELLPSVAIGFAAGFSSACAVRSFGILFRNMPPISLPSFLIPYMPELSGILGITSLATRFLGDAYHHYRSNDKTVSQNLRHTTLGVGLTLLSGAITLAETLTMGSFMIRFGIPMTGNNMILISMFGGFLSSTQDMYLRNYCQIIDQPFRT